MISAGWRRDKVGWLNQMLALADMDATGCEGCWGLTGRGGCGCSCERDDLLNRALVLGAL